MPGDQRSAPFHTLECHRAEVGFFCIAVTRCWAAVSLDTQLLKASLPLLHQNKNLEMEPGNAFKALSRVNF